MKKRNAKPKKATSSTKNKSGVTENSLLSRRNAVRMLIALPLAGVAGAAIHQHDKQSRILHDLTSIGSGSPVIVQIHDPGCPKCRSLMGNAKTALKGRDELLYRVADITKGTGKQFQQKYGVSHVTLLLFNGEGRLVNTVQGVTPVQELAEHFDALANAS